MRYVHFNIAQNNSILFNICLYETILFLPFQKQSICSTGFVVFCNFVFYMLATEAGLY